MSTEEELEDEAFKAQMLGEPITPAEADDDESPPDATVTPEPTPEPERVEIIPGYTKEEFDNIISDIPRVRSALDKAQGTYGQKMQALQAEIDQLKAADPSDVDFTDLAAEYPDLAELLVKGFKKRKAVSTPTPEQQTPVVDMATYQRDLDAKVAEAATRVYAEKRLEEDHPDYRQVALWTDNNPQRQVVFHDAKFGNWIARQPKGVQDVVLTSDDPRALSKVLTDYKTASKSTTPNLDIVREAIQPKGINTMVSAKSDEELEDEAFRAEMKKHIL